MKEGEKEKANQCGDVSMYIDRANHTYALACYLPKGHEGEHKDSWHGVTWFIAEPARPPATT